MISSNDHQLLDLLTEFYCQISGKLFWDGKWNDISNTVAGAASGIQPLLPKFVNIHASSGIESIKKAVENSPNNLVLGVTVLTSISKHECVSIFGSGTSKKVVKFAKDLVSVDAHGIICSPQELLALEKFTKLIKVVPGIRPAWAPSNDQKRITTPREAIDAGADYLVIGRPITNPPKEIGTPLDAVKKIIEEISD